MLPIVSRYLYILAYGIMLLFVLFVLVTDFR
jgi:hypothetical protein